MKRFLTILSGIGIVISLLLIQNAFAEFENEYRYFDGYGYHILPYNLTSGEISKIDCDDYNIIIYVTSELGGEMSILIPRTFYDPPYFGDPDMFLLLINGYESHITKQESSEESIIVILEYKGRSSDIELLGTTAGSPPYYCKTKPINSKYYEILLSPRKQVTSGILPENVICKEGLELIVKSTNGNRVCVKPTTAEKLLQRGWGILPLRGLPTS